MVGTQLRLSDAGWIPEDWETVNLSDVFLTLEAGVSVNSDETANTHCYVLKTSAISEGCFLPTEVKPVIAADCKRTKCSLIKGSIVISRMNTPQLVGECGYIDEDYPQYFLPDRLWQAQNWKPEEYNFKWLSYVLSYGQFRDAIRASGTGTSNSMKNISKDVFGEICIPKPAKKEQDAIADVLSDMDLLIKKQQSVVDKLRGLKQAHLHEMFPEEDSLMPGVRLPGFSNHWVERSLGSCFSERQERSAEGELLSITINDGIKRFSELGRRDNSSADKSNYKKVEVGDIAYNSMRMWQGASGYSPYSGIVSPAYTVLVPAERIDSLFFSYVFKRYAMIKQFKIFSQGMTSDTWNLKYPMLSEIKVLVPEYEEQQAIAHYFAQLDMLIESNEKKLDKYRNIKQGAMSKLLTGKIRLI